MASKVNDFLKEMTEATGLYGDDLFAFIRKKCLPEKVEEKKTEEEDFFPVGTYTFTGDYSDLKEFYLAHGGDPKKAKFMGSCVPGYAAIFVAELLKKERFEWTLPTKIWQGLGKPIVDGWAKHSCWYLPETGKYDFDDGEIVKFS